MHFMTLGRMEVLEFSSRGLARFCTTITVYQISNFHKAVSFPYQSYSSSPQIGRVRRLRKSNVMKRIYLA